MTSCHHIIFRLQQCAILFFAFFFFTFFIQSYFSTIYFIMCLIFFLSIISLMIYHFVFQMHPTKIFIHFFHHVLPISFSLFFETVFFNFMFNPFTLVNARTFLIIEFVIQFALYFLLNGKIFSFNNLYS